MREWVSEGVRAERQGKRKERVRGKEEERNKEEMGGYQEGRGSRFAMLGVGDIGDMVLVSKSNWTVCWKGSCLLCLPSEDLVRHRGFICSRHHYKDLAIPRDP